MRTIRITNPGAMDLEALRHMIEEASAYVPDHPPVDDVLDWLRKNVEDPKIAFIVATEGGVRFQGCALVSLYTDLWTPTPWVVSVYSRRPEVRRALGDAMQEVIRGAGFDRCRAINQTGASDQVYARIWRNVATVRVIGPAVELKALDPESPRG